MSSWIHPPAEPAQDWPKQKTSCPEGIDGAKQRRTQKGLKTTLGKWSALTAIKRGILLAIVPRSSTDSASSASGNHVLGLAATNKPKSKATTNKYERFVTTALQSKGPKTGSPTSPTNKTTSKNLSCNRCWELRGRIFKALEPDGLGKSYLL